MKRLMNLVFLFVSWTTLFLVSCSDETTVTFPANSSDQVRNTNFAAWEPFSIAVSAANYSGLSLEAINGAIVIRQSSGVDSMRISGEKRVESESTEDAKAHLLELKVDVQDMTSEILVRTVQPTRSGGRHYIVNYTITLPENMNVKVNSANGKVTLDEIVGSVSANVVNGEIDGRITLPVDGAIDMRITNGSMGLRIPRNTSAEFSATVATGNINLSNLELHNRTETPTSLHGTFGDGRGTVSLKATNGNIRVTGF